MHFQSITILFLGPKMTNSIQNAKNIQNGEILLEHTCTPVIRGQNTVTYLLIVLLTSRHSRGSIYLEIHSLIIVWPCNKIK